MAADSGLLPADRSGITRGASKEDDDEATVAFFFVISDSSTSRSETRTFC